MLNQMENTEKTIHNWNDWKFGDLIFGVVVPTIVAFLIVGVALLLPSALIGLKYSLLEAIVIVGARALLGKLQCSFLNTGQDSHLWRCNDSPSRGELFPYRPPVREPNTRFWCLSVSSGQLLCMWPLVQPDPSSCQCHCTV